MRCIHKNRKELQNSTFFSLYKHRQFPHIKQPGATRVHGGAKIPRGGFRIKTQQQPSCRTLAISECRMLSCPSPHNLAGMTMTIKLDGNWSSCQLTNSAPPLSITDSAISSSAAATHTLLRLRAAPRLFGEDESCRRSHRLHLCSCAYRRRAGANPSATCSKL